VLIDRRTDDSIVTTANHRLKSSQITVGRRLCYLLSTRSTQQSQPSIPPGYVNRVPACMAGVKAGRVRLCWVAGNTVWSHMASDVP